MYPNLLKIGIFYDGNFFLHVSNYYYHCHSIRRRIYLPGFHEFLRRDVSVIEGVKLKHCQITTAHFFRGRFSAVEARESANHLYNDRVFDDILMSLGIETHYLPLRSRGDRKREKGIDVWFALEAYEQCLNKQLDVVFLITSDNEHLPLLRKLRGLGVITYILNWNFTFVDSHGNQVSTLTSHDLLNEACRVRDIDRMISEGLSRGDWVVNGMFVTPSGGIRPGVVDRPSDSGEEYGDSEEEESYVVDEEQEEYPEGEGQEVAEGQVYSGRIVNIIHKKGYGFISTQGENLFFYYKEVLGMNFQDLQVGDLVSYTMGKNKDGRDIALNVRLLEPGPSHGLNSWGDY